jgi:hypothetical protein
MNDDTKPVPEPGEAQRGDGVHYFEVDETDVGEAAEDSEPADDREEPGTAAND